MASLVGKSLGHYHITKQLGEGGMATVYKAFDTHLERDVAIKVIRTDQFAPSVLQNILKRFEREAKLLGKLSHPNIVNVIDFGEHDSVPYLVMVYLPGGTLKQLLVKPLAANEAAQILLPIAKALDYAHRQGVTHRDVKPSNILITSDGEPMLTDFGIAKLLESDNTQTLTGTGVGVGTPEYMSPEQWVGKASAASDQYSLGVIFYEMITGHKPYAADTPAAILLKQANDPLPSPSLFVNDLSDETERILFKSMAKKPEDRYVTMGELSEALANLSLAGRENSNATRIAPITQTSLIDHTLATRDSLRMNSQNEEIPPPSVPQKVTIKGNPKKTIIISVLLLVVLLVSIYSIVDAGRLLGGGLTHRSTETPKVNVFSTRSGNLATLTPGSTQTLATSLITPTYQVTINSTATNRATVSSLVYGCTNPSAINYNSMARVDDGSCMYSATPIPATSSPIWGCTDPGALNFDSSANMDDGSCISIVYGCIDPGAINFNPSANWDDGSCYYEPPDDPTAEEPSTPEPPTPVPEPPTPEP